MTIVLPAVQDIREVARNISCKNNLRQLGMALQSYESANQFFPPGSLGDPETWIVTEAELAGWDSDASHPMFYQNHQYTSWIVLALPYCEFSSLYDPLPRISINLRINYATYLLDNPGSPAWLGDLPEVHSAATQNLVLLFCPSDNLETEQATTPRTVGAQPAFITDEINADRILALANGGSELASTNYLGCTGAYSGGNVADDSMERFVGLMKCRMPTRAADVRDGLSNTIAIGESLGLIVDRKRLASNSWFFAAMGRGRSELDWQKPYSSSYPGLRLLGDSW